MIQAEGTMIGRRVVGENKNSSRVLVLKRMSAGMYLCLPSELTGSWTRLTEA